jgi:hypothetical protein
MMSVLYAWNHVIIVKLQHTFAFLNITLYYLHEIQTFHNYSHTWLASYTTVESLVIASAEKIPKSP